MTAAAHLQKTYDLFMFRIPEESVTRTILMNLSELTGAAIPHSARPEQGNYLQIFFVIIVITNLTKFLVLLFSKK